MDQSTDAMMSKMNPDQWQRVEALFHQALEYRGEERADFLHRTCTGDDDLRTQVESLIAAGERADSRIEGAVEGVLRMAADEGRSADEGSGEEPLRIGPYQVKGELGRGGLSTVYLAQRADEQYRMKVAVKVIRRGLDTENVLDRLRQERQILAALDHPNIARLFDGGSTDDGLPYVVMEYIQGEPIDRHCQHRALSVSERLKLFRPLCSAVQYAHRNLVIHRDIKPANILVAENGVPKLLDFGIAKLLDPGLVETPMAPTATAVRLLTPEYASPEQVRGEPLTTATDVYSLGVLLYYLLTGRPPYTLESRRPRDIEKAVCEAEPKKPSVGSPEKLRRQLSGDLDNIVLMAMAKEPDRRYASVEQFSEDLRRYLEALPVVARKPTWRYRSGRFLRRHRAAVAATALILLALLGGVASTVWQARIAVAERIRAELNLARAETEKAGAEMERAKAEQAFDFLSDLFEASDPEQHLGQPMTVREVLDQSARRIEQDLQMSPELRATLMVTMGRVYQKMGDYDRAAQLLEGALEIRRQMPTANARGTDASFHLALVRYDQGDYIAAEGLLRETLAKQRALYGDKHREVAASLHYLALTLRARGELENADTLMHQALGLRREVLPEDDPDLVRSLNDLGELSYDLDDFEASTEYFRQALELGRHVLAEGHPQTTTSLQNLAVLHYHRGEYTVAEELFREILALRRKVQGNEHPYVAISLNNLAAVLESRNDFDGAEKLYRESLEIDRKVQGPEHIDVAKGIHNLASALEAKGDFEAAETLFRQSLAIKRKLGADKVTLGLGLNRLASLVASRGRPDEALTLYREARDILLEATPAGARDLAMARAEIERLAGN